MLLRSLSGRIFLLLCLLIYGNLLHAQEAPDFLGTKTPYSQPIQKHTPPPPGFKPVFINYVGRHGSRFMTKSGTDSLVWKLLHRADVENGLTPAGHKIEEAVKKFLLLQKDNYENISLLGRQEQAAIGKRMMLEYPTVFLGHGLEIYTTKKLRTRQSADAFLIGFQDYRGEKKFAAVNDTMDMVLRFYDISPAYLAYKKSNEIIRSIDSLHHDPRTRKFAQNICSRLFTATFQKKLNAGISVEEERRVPPFDPENFTDDLFDVYCAAHSLSVESKQAGYAEKILGMGTIFKKDELDWFSFRNGAEDFLEKGAGRDSVGIQVKVAVPLLVDFINTMDAAAASATHPDAILRFTHAEAISPFACLLDLPKTSTPSASIFQYEKNWKTSFVIPMSANIQWILYSDGRNKLVKALLNEKEIALPVKTSVYPYYDWNDVKQYYLKKLHNLGAGLHADMNSYLTRLK